VSRFVKVVQSGQGADEVFGGYHWYPPLQQAGDPAETYRQVFFDRDFAEYASTVSDAVRQREDHPFDFVKKHFESPGAPGPVDKALRLDTRVMLVDDPVKRVDNHTMASGLEARVPFLDHELVEFAAKVPADLKIRDEGKWVLKEAARSVIPAGVIDRPKGYFPVPALKYLKGDFLEMTRVALTSDRARQRGLFDSKAVDQLLARPEDHITPLGGSKLYQLALLEMWLETHGI